MGQCWGVQTICVGAGDGAHVRKGRGDCTAVAGLGVRAWRSTTNKEHAEAIWQAAEATEGGYTPEAGVDSFLAAVLRRRLVLLLDLLYELCISHRQVAHAALWVVRFPSRQQALQRRQ